MRRYGNFSHSSTCQFSDSSGLFVSVQSFYSGISLEFYSWPASHLLQFPNLCVLPEWPVVYQMSYRHGFFIHDFFIHHPLLKYLLKPIFQSLSQDEYQMAHKTWHCLQRSYNLDSSTCPKHIPSYILIIANMRPLNPANSNLQPTPPYFYFQCLLSCPLHPSTERRLQTP